MVDFRLLNGKPRAALIQRFDGSVLLLGARRKKIEFNIGVTLHEVQTKVAKTWLGDRSRTSAQRERNQSFLDSLSWVKITILLYSRSVQFLAI